MDRDVDHDHLHRRTTEENVITRATGHSLHQLLWQVLGGVLIAAAVGAISVWGTALVLGERLANLSDQVRTLSNEVREIRRDFYPPRYGRDKSAAAADVLPARRP